MFAIVLAVMLATTRTRAATVDDFVPRNFSGPLGLALPYRLFIPANYDPTRKYPLVLFMHGGGERGTDNRFQLVGQTGALVFVSTANQQ